MPTGRSSSLQSPALARDECHSRTGRSSALRVCRYSKNLTAQDLQAMSSSVLLAMLSILPYDQKQPVCDGAVASMDGFFTFLKALKKTQTLLGSMHPHCHDL